MATRFLTIHFLDGTKLSLSFPQQEGDPEQLTARVNEAMASRTLSFESQGELFVIPTTSIKYLQVNPAPDPLPDGTILSARLRGE